MNNSVWFRPLSTPPFQSPRLPLSTSSTSSPQPALTVIPYSETAKTCREKIENIVKTQSGIPDDLITLLSDIDPNTLDNKKSWQYELLIKGIEPGTQGIMNQRVVSCIFCAAKSPLRQKIADIYKTNLRALSLWVAEALLLEQDQNKKINILTDILAPLNLNQLLVILQIFTSQNSHALPYFFCAFPNEKWEDFFTLEELCEHPEKLSNAIANSSAHHSVEYSKVAEHLESQHRLRLILDDCSFPIETTTEDQDAAGSSFYGNFIIIMRDTESALKRRLYENDIDYLQAIPPFLLILGMHSEEFKKTIIHSLPYLTNKQLQAVGNMMSLNVFETTLQIGRNAVINDIFLTLAKSLDSKIFESYCKSQVTRIDNVLMAHAIERNAFVDVLKIILENAQTQDSKPFTEIEFDKILQKKSKIDLPLILCNSPSLPPFANYCKELLNADLNRLPFINFISSVKKIQTRNSFINNDADQQLIKKLTELRSAKENDDDNELPEEFLYLMTTDMLGFLEKPNGINVVDWLGHVGIKNTSDLQILGYSHEKHLLLQQLRDSIITATIPKDNPHSSTGEEAWNILFYSNNNFDLFLQIYLQSHPLAECPDTQEHEAIITRRKNLHAKLLPILYKLEVLNPQDTPAFNEVLSNALNCYRQAITVQLRRYMNQNYLNGMWMLLKIQGNSSLSDLYKKEILKANDDAFNLINLRK